MFCHLHCTNAYNVVCNGENEYFVVYIETLYLVSSAVYMIQSHLFLLTEFRTLTFVFTKSCRLAQQFKQYQYYC